MSNIESIVQRQERQTEIISMSDLAELLQVGIDGYDIEFNGPSEQRAREMLMNLPKTHSFAIKVRGDDGKDYVFHPLRPIDSDSDNVERFYQEPGEKVELHYEKIEEPVLCIDNFPDFVQALKDLTKASWDVQHQPGLAEYYVNSEEKRTGRITSNATPYDFREPVKFFSRQTQLIRGFGLESLQENLGYEPVPSLHANVTLKLIREGSEYETPFSIAPIFNFENPREETRMELCRVRVGIFEEGGVKKALLYAVQSGERIEKERKSLQEHIGYAVDSIHSLSGLYRNLYSQNPQRFIQIFGEFPPDLFNEKDDFVFYQDLRTTMQNNMIKRFGGGYLPHQIADMLFREYPDEKLVSSAENNQYIPNFALGITKIRSMSDVSEEEINGMQDQISIIDNKARFYKQLGRKLGTSAPPKHVAGLTTTLAKLQAIGVEEVVMPLYLPLRALKRTVAIGEESSDEIENRKLDNLIETLAFITANCDGIEMWQDPGMSEDGISYMSLKLGKMSSDKPLLQDLIEAGKSL